MSSKRLILYLLVPFGLIVGIVLAACAAAEQGTRYQDLVLQISTNRTRANVGDEVAIHFTVTNDGKQPVQISSEDRPVLDLQVDVAGSDEVLFSWVALHPDQAAKELIWQPGETKTIDAVWTPTRQGFYNGRNVFLAGLLSKDSKIVQSAGILICLGGCER
jgi:hypothetical protein